MATQGGASRLAQMQMRFQQKQQQDREQRKLELSGPSKSNLESGDSRSLNASTGAGKVRQMFDERRQRSTGIDKSYPLKPIAGRTTPGSTATTKTSTTTTTTVRKQQVSKQVNGRISSTKTNVREVVHSVNGNGTSTSERFFTNDNLDDETMPESPIGFERGLNGDIDIPDFSKLSLRDSNRNSVGSIGERNNNNGRAELTSTIKLKPVITKKTAPPALKSSPTSSTTVRVAPKTTRMESSPSKSSFTPTTRSRTVTKTPPGSASSGMSFASSASMSKSESPSKMTPRSIDGPIPENMARCSICGRNFNQDRIEKHRQICEKTATKKRKVFDVVKHRIQGTEIEQYTRKAPKGHSRPAAQKTSTATATATASDKKSNWRRKHEEFIRAIRAAKEMQAHLARGGKLSDLPPPPPSENPDYVQCPHCQRRFNEAAASRHIPKCATMLHNKPKPGAKAPPKKR